MLNAVMINNVLSNHILVKDIYGFGSVFWWKCIMYDELFKVYLFHLACQGYSLQMVWLKLS